MSKRNRDRRRANAHRRTALGFDESKLPRSVRRDLGRKMKDVPTLAEVQADLVRFSPSALIDLVTERVRPEPPFLIARLVREVAQFSGEGSVVPTESDLSRILSGLANLADPMLTKHLGGNFSELVVTRLLASQVHTQRDFLTDFPRVLSILADPEPLSPIGPAEWNRLLGVDLVHFLLGVMVLSGVLERGPLDLDAYLAIDGESEPNHWVRSVVTKLAGDLLALRRVAAEQRPSRQDDRLYQPGPLLSLPLYRRSDGRVAAPAIDFVRLASSPPSLYLRLIHADHESRSRERSGVVGHRFHAYLVAYIASGAAPGWQVRDLDEAPSPASRIADIAVWPDDKSFLVVIEGKTSLQLFDAQLGNDDSRRRMESFYQGSFDQIDATIQSIGENGFLADAPTQVPIYGLTVTFDLHLTTVIEKTTHVGLVLDYRPPQRPGATSAVPCRVLPVTDFERLADLLCWARPEQVRAVLDGVFSESCPAGATPLSIRKNIEVVPDHPPINRTIVDAFDKAASSVEDPVLSRELRSVAASLLG